MEDVVFVISEYKSTPASLVEAIHPVQYLYTLPPSSPMKKVLVVQYIAHKHIVIIKVGVLRQD